MKSLLGFYKAYSDWIDAGAPQGKPFSRKVGLCSNLLNMYGDNGIILREMGVEFEDENLEAATPFDQDYEEYIKTCDNSACHLNEKRVQWVKNKLKEGENK